MRDGREFERLKPWGRGEAVDLHDVVGIEDDVERAGDHAQKPKPGETPEMAGDAGLARPGRARYPREDYVICGFGGHGPCRSVAEGGDLRNPALQKERGQDGSHPEHEMGVSGA